MSRNRAILGTAAMAVGNVFKLAAQLAILPIIARILGPSAYGVVSLATPFVFFLLLFGDLGLGATLVRKLDVSREHESSVFWLSLCVALTLFLIMNAVAYPLGGLLHEPQVAPLLVGFSPMFFLAASAVVPATRLQRQGRFLTVAGMELTASLVSMGAAIWAAMSGWGAWSLVAQQLVFWVLKVSILFGTTRFFPLFVFRFDLIRPSLIFGAGILGAQIASFFGTSLDNILIGAIIGSTPLGFYALAYQIINIPPSVLGAAHYSVFPAVADAHQKGLSPEKTYLDVLRVILMIAAPALVGLAMTADLAVSFIFGEAWMPAVPLIQFLAVTGIINTTFILNGALILGIGRSDIEFKTTLMRVGSATVGILCGMVWGTKGVAIGVSLAVMASSIIYFRYVISVGGISVSRLIEAITGPVAATLVLAVAVFSLRRLLPPEWPAYEQLGVCVAVGGGVYVAALFLLFKEKFQQDVVLVKSILLKRGA